MGLRGDLFTTDVKVKNRTYFFNVKENRTGDIFLQIVETKNLEGSDFERRTVVIFEDDMRKFLQGFDSSLSFIEKERKNRQKARAEKREAGYASRERRADSESRGSSRLPRKETGSRSVRVVVRKRDPES